MAQEKRNIYIGSAWPYANGSLHLGHVAGLIGADFLARYYRAKGDNVLFVSGSDCHGTPIEVKAEQLGTKPEAVVAEFDVEFRKNLIDQMGFSYDLFYKTADPFHYKKVQKMFLDLYEKGLVYEKVQSLPFCESCNRFLPDRYIEGECPKCHFSPARGDQCDECGSILDAKDLIDPKCKSCGKTPIWKDSTHFFLKLSAFEKELTEWVKKSQGWRPNALNFTLKFLEKGLIDRAITRDSKWGVPVPIKGFEEKTIYVWFEAVSGYLTASQKYSVDSGQPDLWKDFWHNDKALHYYVHGKDNIPFHTVIWPAILMGLGGLELADRIVSSEYLSFEGKQFSKSRNWGVWLPEFLETRDAETLRYYLGINGPESADSDFSWKEYQVKVNTELIGKIGNFVNRALSFTKNNFEGKVPSLSSPDAEDEAILAESKAIFEKVGQLIEASSFHEALKTVLAFAEECNRYIDKKEPWKKIKESQETAGGSINVSLQAVSALSGLLIPFLPRTAEKIRQQLGLPQTGEWKFEALEAGHTIGEPKPLFDRVEI